MRPAKSVCSVPDTSRREVTHLDLRVVRASRAASPGRLEWSRLAPDGDCRSADWGLPARRATTGAGKCGRAAAHARRRRIRDGCGGDRCHSRCMNAEEQTGAIHRLRRGAPPVAGAPAQVSRRPQLRHQPKMASTIDPAAEIAEVRPGIARILSVRSGRVADRGYSKALANRPGAQPGRLKCQRTDRRLRRSPTITTAAAAAREDNDDSVQ